MSVAQRKCIKREELQQLIDDQIIDTDAATLRGIIREELQTQTTVLENTIKLKYDGKIKAVEEENSRLKKENTEIKKAVSEQQKFLERLRSEKNMDNIFISGIPNKMVINELETNDANLIVGHILKYVSPDLTPENYKILKNFEPREGHDRHSTKIKCSDQGVKKKIFVGCKKS